MDWKFVPQFDSILMFGFAKPPAAGRTAGESNFSAALCSSCKSLLKLQADRFPTPFRPANSQLRLLGELRSWFFDAARPSR
jgi:hypothetical protein